MATRKMKVDWRRQVATFNAEALRRMSAAIEPVAAEIRRLVDE